MISTGALHQKDELLIEEQCDEYCIEPLRNNQRKREQIVLLNANNAFHGANGRTSFNGVTARPAEKHINPRNYDDLLELAEIIRKMAALGDRRPEVGIICGSGLGGLADGIEKPKTLPFAKIPGFPSTHVEGHKGNLVFGELGGSFVMCLQGRFHCYEHNMDMALCTMPVRLMHILGVKTLIVSNAAGGVNPNFHLEDLMMIKDHIFMPGLIGFSPTIGINDPRFGSRFISMHNAYDLELRKIARKIADKDGYRIQEGVYVMSSGPQYETPAEVALYKAVGADALGMSTCHEVTVARQCHMRVFGFSLITNICNMDSDSSVEVSHEEVIQTGKAGGDRACRLVTEIIKSLKSLE